MNEIKTIAIYARVSTGRQEQEETIENQILIMSEHAEKHGYIIADRYIEDGWTSEFLARPSLDKLREEAKTKRWDAVLVYDADRISRKYAHQELVIDELNEIGIQVLYVTIAPPKNPEEKILFGVRGLFAEYEREKIKERFRIGKIRKVKAGHILHSVPNYGYRKIPRTETEPARLEVDENEAIVIRRMFSWLIEEDLTIRKIITRLSDLGIKPRRSKRGVWNTSTLCQMLRNPVYKGLAKWQSRISVAPIKPLALGEYKRIKRTSRRVRPKEDWLFVSVPAIIDTDTFDKAQEALKSNAERSQRNKRNDYLLGGRIFCICGRRRNGEGPQRGRYTYYRCQDRISSYPLPRSCMEHSINAQKIDEEVWSRIQTAMSSKEILLAHVQRAVAEKATRASITLSEQEKIGEELKRLRKQEKRLQDAYLNGLFDLESFRQYLEPVKKGVTELENKLNKANSGLDKAMHPTEEIISDYVRRSKLKLTDLNFQKKRAIVLNTVERIVGTKESAKVDVNIKISNVEQESNYRSSKDATRQTVYSIPFTFEIKF